MTLEGYLIRTVWLANRSGGTDGLSGPVAIIEAACRAIREKVGIECVRVFAVVDIKVTRLISDEKGM